MLLCNTARLAHKSYVYNQDAVYGEGQDDVIKPKMPASRKRKSAEEEQSVKEEADAIDFKVMLCRLSFMPCLKGGISKKLHILVC